MTRKELEETLDGRRLVVSVSGGKDSTACCLYLMEMGYGPDEYDRIFFDTGWEHPFLYEYIDGELTDSVGPVTRLSATVELNDELELMAQSFEERLGHPSAMVRLCLKKAMFSSRMRRWCTDQLKVAVAKDYIKPIGPEVVNVVGIRAEESKARSIMVEWEFAPAFDCEVWRPLLDWKTAEVIDIHQRHGVRPCRLYLEQNAERVGCYPCVYARKAELKAMSDYFPERIELLADLEEAVTMLAERRHEARGDTDRPMGWTPTWFQNPRPLKDPITGKREGEGWPIRKVIAWARTQRGGSMDQLELFTDPVGHQGCVRWGMCDTGTK